MTTKRLLPLLAIALLAACREPDGAPGRGISNGGALNGSDVGTAAGVVAGTVIGWQFGSGAGQMMGAIGGGLLGGLLGDAVGTSFDEEDMAMYQKASQHAMNTGTVTQWKNTKTEHFGEIAPSAKYQARDGRECREFHQSIILDGELHEGGGFACREPDGSWRMIE